LISWLRARLRPIVGALFSECVQPGTEGQYPTVPRTVEDALDELPEDESLVEEIQARAQELYAETDSRRQTIEQKASMLLGATGVAASLLTASAGILLNRTTFDRSEVLAFGILIVSTLVVLLYASYKAGRSLRVTQWGNPGPLALYQHGEQSIMEFRRQWTARLLVAKAFNDEVNNEKGALLGEAQAWFVLGLFLLVCSSVALVLTVIVAG
jgi:hypothetical protein